MAFEKVTNTTKSLRPISTMPKVSLGATGWIRFNSAAMQIYEMPASGSMNIYFDDDSSQMAFEIFADEDAGQFSLYPYANNQKSGIRAYVSTLLLKLHIIPRQFSLPLLKEKHDNKTLFVCKVARMRPDHETD